MTHYDPSNDRAMSGALSGDLFLESSVKVSPRGFLLAFLSLSHTQGYISQTKMNRFKTKRRTWRQRDEWISTNTMAALTELNTRRQYGSNFFAVLLQP